jgi:hypothetical protein
VLSLITTLHPMIIDNQPGGAAWIHPQSERSSIQFVVMKRDELDKCAPYCQAWFVNKIIVRAAGRTRGNVASP